MLRILLLNINLGSMRSSLRSRQKNHSPLRRKLSNTISGDAFALGDTEPVQVPSAARG